MGQYSAWPCFVFSQSEDNLPNMAQYMIRGRIKHLGRGEKMHNCWHTTSKASYLIQEVELNCMHPSVQTAGVYRAKIGEKRPSIVQKLKPFSKASSKNEDRLLYISQWSHRYQIVREYNCLRRLLPDSTSWWRRKKESQGNLNFCNSPSAALFEREMWRTAPQGFEAKSTG